MMTTEQKMRADLYRASFAAFGRWPQNEPNLRVMSDAERAARRAECDRIRAEYAKKGVR